MRKILAALLCFLMTGCVSESPSLKMADTNMNTINATDCNVYVKAQSDSNTDFGFYITKSSLYSSITELEKNSTNHKFYGFEMDIRDVFPLNDVLESYIHGKTPLVTIYADEKNLPNAYELLKLSEAFGALSIPIYVNLAPFSANTWKDLDDYKRFWDTAAKTLNHNAKNTTLIWSVFKEDIPLYEAAMPNEELFSLAGLMFYGDTENSDKEFFNSLDHLCAITKKDIIISSLAVSNFSTGDHIYKSEKTIGTLKKIYSDIEESYPRVSAVLYMDKDLTVSSPPSSVCNDYRVTSEKVIFDAYTDIITLGKENNYDYYKSPFGGKIIDNSLFVKKELFSHHFSSLPDMAEESFQFEGYISVDSLQGYSAFQKDGAIYISGN